MTSQDKNIFKQNKPDLAMNKRGQELSTNAIIMIVIGIIVLVVLVLGFTIGWNRLLPFVSSNNVQNIVTACSTACSTGSTFDFCQSPREVKDGVNDKFTDTCYNLAELTDTGETYVGRNYGIERCPAITCTSP